MTSVNIATIAKAFCWSVNGVKSPSVEIRFPAFPQRTERLLGWRVRRRIEERQRERAAEQRQEQHTERAPGPVAPRLHLQSTEPRFGDAIEGHGCAYFFSATAFARGVPVDPDGFA